MRKISGAQIVVFFGLLALVVVLALLTNGALLGGLDLGDFRGVTLLASAVVLIYLYAFAIYRLFLVVIPLTEGDIAQDSREEFAAQVHFLFYLFVFNSLIRSHFLPVPIMRLVYIALGARLGKNSFSAGAILDPPLTRVGDNCIIGHDAALFSHAIEGNRLALLGIEIGNNVTIGATAVVMPGVTVGDGAIVSAGAVVTQGTVIGAGEIWGGVPAKRLKYRDDWNEAANPLAGGGLS